MASTIQWNAVRKDMVQKISRIAHRRLSKKSPKLCFLELVFCARSVSFSLIPIQIDLLGFFDWTQISDVVQLSFFHFYIAFSTEAKVFNISLTVTTKGNSSTYKSRRFVCKLYSLSKCLIELLRLWVSKVCFGPWKKHLRQT